MTTHTIIEELLVRGLDDWMLLAEVAEVVSEETLTQGEDLVKAVIDVLHTMIESKLVVIGSMDQNGFTPWDESIEVSLTRVRREWQPPGRLLGIGEVCWLSTTLEGDRLAKEVVRRRDEGR
jgi:hypothetical protein